MKEYFNIKLEFDKDKVDEIIQSTIVNKGKGYVCSVESNNLTVANKSKQFQEVVNGALVNICDGSVLAKILGIIHKKTFTSYVGADLFTKYIRLCRYKQFFLGNTKPILDGLRDNLSKIDPAILVMPFTELPFKKVEEFDYEGIAQIINRYKPDIIWVSLGAPKQEFFMNNLLPHLDQGIMFGFGAIFNFNAGIGSVKRAPIWMRKMKLEWLHRTIEEPKKNIPRYWNFVMLMPKLIVSEIRKKNGK